MDTCFSHRDIVLRRRIALSVYNVNMVDVSARTVNEKAYKIPSEFVLHFIRNNAWPVT